MSHPEPEDSRWELEFAFRLFKEGAMGVKEFRNYLAAKDKTFEEIRDSSMDDDIDSKARLIQAIREREQDALREDRDRRQRELANRD
jgi:hypothetical protein